MFWGIHVKASPKIAKPVEYLFSESVKLSQVALEPPMSTRVGKTNTPNGTKNKKDKNQSLVESPSDNQKVTPVSLMVEHDDKQFVLCTLDPGRNWQCPLDLVFQAGTSVKFSLRGHGTLHLTGYEIPDDMDDDDDMISFDEDVDEDVDEDSEMEVSTKAKPDKKVKGKKVHTNGVAKGEDGKKIFIQKPIFLAKPSHEDEDVDLAKPSHDDDDDDESSEDLDFEANSDDEDDESESDMEEDDSADGDESDESEYE